MGSPAARAAARDGRALNRLLREAFKFSVRYYVQLARAPIVDRAYLERWLVVETPDVLEATIGSPGGSMFVGLHMGWFELPALLAAARTGRPAVVPSETISDPALQDEHRKTRWQGSIALGNVANHAQSRGNR